MTKIKNSIIWITGASSGIGEALAYQLAGRGAKLILSARRVEELNRVADNCNTDDVYILPLDLEKTSEIKDAVARVINAFGHIDILVNNAGKGQRSLAKDTTVDVYRQLMEVNFFGAVTLSQYLLPHFIERQKGHFVTISSIAGKIGSAYRTGYAASKHALHGYFDSLRAEHHKDNIRVSIICPGWVNTSLSKNALTGDGTPLGNNTRKKSGGMSPEYCARKIKTAIEKEKAEIWLGGKEKLAVYLKRFFPGLFRIVIRKYR